MSEKVVLGLIGAGKWGENYIRVLSSISNVELKYICDKDAEVTSRLSRLWPNIAVTSYTAQVNLSRDVQGVVIATPPNTHADLIKVALKADKHILVEKPMTVTSYSAKASVFSAQKRGLILMVGHLMLYHPAIGYISGMIQDESVSPNYLYSQRLNLGTIRTDENVWWSLAPHDISTACYLLRCAPLAVSAHGRSYIQKGVEDVVFATLVFPSNKIAHIHVSWLDPGKVRRLVVVGEKRMVVFNDMEPVEKVRVYEKGVIRPDPTNIVDGDVTIPKISRDEPLRRECEEFVSAIKYPDSNMVLADGENGLTVVKILEAGQKSLERKGELINV